MKHNRDAQVVPAVDLGTGDARSAPWARLIRVLAPTASRMRLCPRQSGGLSSDLRTRSRLSPLRRGPRCEAELFPATALLAPLERGLTCPLENGSGGCWDLDWPASLRNRSRLSAGIGLRATPQRTEVSLGSPPAGDQGQVPASSRRGAQKRP